MLKKVVPESFKHNHQSLCTILVTMYRVQVSGTSSSLCVTPIRYNSTFPNCWRRPRNGKQSETKTKPQKEL